MTCDHLIDKKSHAILMKWGYKYGVASIKTLGNVLRFHKNRENFNQGRKPDIAASVHDVFLFLQYSFFGQTLYSKP